MVGKSVLGLFAAVTVLAAASEASASESVLRSCVTPLNSGQISAYRFPAANAGVFTAPVSANPSVDTCASYSWVYSDKQSFYFTVMPQWAGPTASFCSHSNIEYAIYSWSSSSWHYSGGGLLWGKDASTGGCSYSVSNWPDISYGANMTRAGVLPLGSYYVVAVKTSAHNHSGHDCGSAVSCYWPTALIYVRL